MTQQPTTTWGRRLARHVEQGAMPGFVALVAHGDHVDVEVVGAKSFVDAEPLRRDDIFRIASLTKPITAAAALILVDDGVLRLDETVDDLLPELADRRVLRTIGSSLDDTIPAVRPITLLDLMTSRLGFGSVMAMPGTYPIQVAEAELGLMTLTAPWPPTPHSPDEWIERLGRLPLMAQPGEEWLYNTSSQVLGVLVERAARMPFESFLRERLFGPLGMADTGFSVPADQRHRLTTAFAPDAESGEMHVLDDPSDSWWAQPPAMPSGAGWLVSTVDDFWAFARMLRDGGVHDGQRIIAADSVAAMLADQLTPAQRSAATMFLEDGSWGFGLTVPAADANGSVRRPGGYGWDGGTGTSWRAVGDVTGILFTQRAMTSPQPPAVFTDFWDAVLDG